MFFVKLCVILVFVHREVVGQSPCPNIFEYSYDNRQTLFGIISAPVPPNFGNAIVLDVEFTVGNNVQGFIGKIHLLESSEVTIQNIMWNRPLKFRLELPQWVGVMPKVTKILVNKMQICAGNPIRQSEAPVVTTINLKYTLNVSIPSRPSRPIFPFPEDDQPYVPPVMPSIPQSHPTPPQVIYVPNTQKPYIPLPIPTTTSTTTTTTRIPLLPPKINVPTNLFEDNICGTVDNSVQLVHHGEVARKADFPWLGALFKQSSSGGNFICGATLFTKKHALTAAHCVNGVRPSRLHLVLGRENINQWLSEGEQIQVLDTHVHENYIPRQGDGDIAILKLSKQVSRFTAVIRPICLWNTDDNLNNVVDSTGVVVGWGVDETGVSSSIPRKATLPITSNEVCLRSHTAYSLLTSNRTFCAGYRNDSGPCSGDSGSGFYMERNGRWYLRGIVSLSLLANDTCDLQNFVVFADAAKFKDWILEYVG